MVDLFSQLDGSKLSIQTHLPHLLVDFYFPEGAQRDIDIAATRGSTAYTRSITGTSSEQPCAME